MLYVELLLLRYIQCLYTHIYVLTFVTRGKTVFQVAEQKGSKTTPTVVTETMLEDILGVTNRR